MLTKNPDWVEEGKIMDSPTLSAWAILMTEGLISN